MRRALKGTEEYRLLQEFFRFRQEMHEPGPEENAEEFINRTASAAQALADRYAPPLQRFLLGLLAVHVRDLQLTHLEKREAGEYEIVLRKKLTPRQTHED